MPRASACLLFGLLVFVGCGGRTDSLDFGGGASGPASSGASGFGVDSGAPGGGFGASAGAPAGGAPGFAGGPSFGGAPVFAGAPSFGGALPGGGGPSFGGALPGGGAPSFGGFSGGSGGTGALGDVLVEACVAVSSTACEKCECTSCPSQVVGCFSNAGCLAIFACVARTGCQGLGCYLNGPCKKTIDDNGGVQGVPLSAVFALASCSGQAATSCACN